MNNCIIKYRKNNKLLKILYNLLCECQLERNIILNPTIVKYNLSHEKWIPLEIKNFIRQNNGKTYKLQYNICNKNIYLTIVNYYIEDKIIKKYIEILLFIIEFLFKFSDKKCQKNIQISLFLTPFKKYYTDKSQLDIINVNTGFSTIGCNETTSITIYRNEECLKVLIHELFHNLNLDFATVTINKDKLYNEFGINSKYDITETYCEIWARIINILIKSFINTCNYIDFSNQFIDLINIEREYSLIMANRAIKNLILFSDKQEKTNVFCYYILTSALLNNYNNFMMWCYTNNPYFLRFNKKNIESFIQILIEYSRYNNYIKSLKCASNIIYKSKSFNMAIVNIIS
tara:strand:+ start:1234 stop:2268 length:1035 start_codon:yes stop_codon:yes gene_type:complete